jgi:O-antigen biosynthesis protein WbqP
MSLKRVFDIILSAILLVFSLPLACVIAAMIKITSRGSVLYWSDRIGKNNVIFQMPKFRTMATDTPALATHLMANAHHYVTPVGSFLRRTSLDEIPQLWSILRGDMSFVGPRPALFNQDDLVALRTQWGLHLLMPGLTGWAQINGRDSLTIEEKALLDKEYAAKHSFCFDMYIFIRTLRKIFWEKDVSH